MDTLTILVLVLLAAILLLLLWREFFGKKGTNQDQKLLLELEREKEEKHKFQGENKSLWAENTQLKTQKDSLQERFGEVQKKLTEFESKEAQRKKEQERQITDLESARLALEDEKKRIRRQDEERLAQAEAERDRIWNEHENVTLAFLREVCQKPELDFPFFENTSLPDSFDGSFKPDFLVEFLGQYLIFDAKMSRSQNLQNYLNEQVKSTALKIKKAKNREQIYPVIFLIVPTADLPSLKKITFFEDGLSFFVISREACEPILTSYKRISLYENLESLDPQERENIVNLLANYEHRLSLQNAHNILNSILNLQTLKNKEKLTPELLAEIKTQFDKIRLETFKPTDLKRLAKNSHEQAQEILKLTQSQEPPVQTEELEDAANLFKK